MKANFKSILMLILLVVAVILAVSAFNNFDNEEEKFTYGDLVELLEADAVKTLTIDGESTVVLKAYEYYYNDVKNDDGTPKLDEDGNPVRELVVDKTKEKDYELPIVYNFQLERINELAEANLADGNLESLEIDPPEETPWYVSYLPFIIAVIIIIIIGFFVMRSASGGGKMNSFSKAKAKVTSGNNAPVKFTDVAGADEEKEELEEVVEFLRDPAKFTKLGARIPRGVLLVGPPGTGKTLLAKAVAGEAGVPFFSISGSDFVEMYVGVGASRVRDLFENARKAPASIIFIDEIDAVGRHRGAGLGGGHDEREQTLNQLLVEMDGFGTNSGVIVIAATNRPDILDPALLRPGRFDRQITVNYPDIKGREEILKVHARNKPLEETVDLKDVAKTTVGFTGADLANLLNEAALLASRRKKSLIGKDDIADAFIRIIAGPKKKALVMKESEKKKTAYHEAGHAMIAYYLDLDPVQQISIIPSGRALGYTLNPPAEDKYSVYKNEMKKEISMLLGGRAAEEIIFNDVSGGASNDIERATKIAKKMVMRLGMSDVLGPRCFGTDQSEVFLGRDFSSSQDYSEEIAARIDSEIHSIIADAYEKAKEILRNDIDRLHFIAEFLVRNEVMDGEQFKATMQANPPVMEEIESIETDRKRRSEEENRKAEEKNQREAEEKAKEGLEEAEPVEKLGENDEFFSEDDESAKILETEETAEQAEEPAEETEISENTDSEEGSTEEETNE